MHYYHWLDTHLIEKKAEGGGRIEIRILSLPHQECRCFFVSESGEEIYLGEGSIAECKKTGNFFLKKR